MFERNQKSVFVLDHTRYFSISSEDFISLDYLKGKPSNDVPGSSVINANATDFSKSLWTSAVESSVEYCRIVWDLFPRGKLVRFIISDTAAHIVNTWNVSTQNVSHVLNAMAMVGVPPRNTVPSSDYSVIHGLRAAIEALAEPTDQQLLVMNTSNEKIPNEGRVICITSARDNTSMKSLEDIFHSVLIQQNTLASTQKKILPIDSLHLVILNIVPKNVETLVTTRGIMDISPILSTEIHTVSAPDISSKLTHLIMSHYDLASTTVTNIPMKEEQNANSSANYDVEILHARSAHTIICGNEALLPTSIKEGAEYETVTLRWCTPRGCGASDLQPCLAQNRVTPVDVTSRPSSCLINFLLNGRSVLLEMPRKMGGKTTSHLLSARGGEIFIHSLQITRTCLEETPSIGDGPGGRVQDYRISDFASLIKAHRFVPLKAKSKHEDNLQHARDRLYRKTRYFPLTFSSSLVYNLQRNLNWMPYFLHKITKEDMDKTDEAQCQQHIYDLYTAAARGEMLPFTINTRMKNSKKAEQYKLLYAELEILLRNYATTPSHKTLLESIQSIRAACGDTHTKSTNITESPLSPGRLENNSSNSSSTSLQKSSKRRTSNCSQRSLLDIVSSAERSASTKRLDFTGRLCTPIGQVAKLYPEFGNKEKDSLSVVATLNVKEETLRN